MFFEKIFCRFLISIYPIDWPLNGCRVIYNIWVYNYSRRGRAKTRAANFRDKEVENGANFPQKRKKAREGALVLFWQISVSSGFPKLSGWLFFCSLFPHSIPLPPFLLPTSPRFSLFPHFANAETFHGKRSRWLMGQRPPSGGEYFYTHAIKLILVWG